MIEVSQHYGIESDGERNYTILKRTVSKKDGSISWNNVAYHQKLEDALESIFRKETKKWLESKDGVDIRRIANEIMEFQKNLMDDMVKKVTGSGN